MSIDVRYIQQVHGKGCGLACVTMIAGMEQLKDYGEAGDYHLDIALQKGMKVSNINAILKECRAEVRIKEKFTRIKAPECLDKFKVKFRDRIEELDAPLLIRIKFHGTNLGHWVIYDLKNDAINDPDPDEQNSPISIDKFIEHYHERCHRLELHTIYTI